MEEPDALEKVRALYAAGKTPADDDLQNALDDAQGELAGLFEDRYGQSQCDENNWYQEEVFVSQDGIVIPMADASDWRGRDEYQKTLMDKPKGERYDFIRTQAMQSVAANCGLFGASHFMFGNEGDAKIAEMSFDELATAFMDHFPEVVEEHFKDFRTKLNAEGADKFHLLYKGKKLASHAEAHLYSFDGMGDFPFGGVDTPYADVLAMDLTYGDRDKGRGILAVDIHT